MRGLGPPARIRMIAVQGCWHSESGEASGLVQGLLHTPDSRCHAPALLHDHEPAVSKRRRSARSPRGRCACRRHSPFENIGHLPGKEVGDHSQRLIEVDVVLGDGVGRVSIRPVLVNPEKPRSAARLAKVCGVMSASRAFSQTRSSTRTTPTT